MLHGLRRIITAVYILIDIVLLGMSFFLPSYYLDQSATNFDDYIGIYAFWIVATVFFCRVLNLYATDRYLGQWREIRRVIRAVTLSTLLAALLVFFFKLNFFSRIVMVTNYSLAVALLIGWRLITRIAVRYLVVSGFNNSNVLVVGAKSAGVQYARSMIDNPHLGLRVVGFLSDENNEDANLCGIPILGTLRDAETIIKKHFIEHVLITAQTSRAQISKLLRVSKELNLTFQMAPDYFNFDDSTIDLRMIGDRPVIEYQALRPNYQMILFKRALDLFLSTFALAILFPILIIIAIMIKADSRGPVFYVSKRWGLKGRLFNCYKFRSMVLDADRMQSDLREHSEVDGPVFKIKNDPRLTRVGKFLRRYSLDELPQIWNVWKGDMSIVGPRPLPEREEVGSYKMDYLRRLLIKPGLTCLWQVRGRSDVRFRRWMKWDAIYMRRWSPFLDLRIILWTIPTILKGKGAY